MAGSLSFIGNPSNISHNAPYGVDIDVGGAYSQDPQTQVILSGNNATDLITASFIVLPNPISLPATIQIQTGAPNPVIACSLGITLIAAAPWTRIKGYIPGLHATIVVWAERNKTHLHFLATSARQACLQQVMVPTHAHIAPRVTLAREVPAAHHARQAGLETSMGPHSASSVIPAGTRMRANPQRARTAPQDLLRKGLDLQTVHSAKRVGTRSAP